MHPDSAQHAMLRRWREQPQRFVREIFGITPDAWQDDVLEAFPHHQRIAMKACKGPGKTAVEAWLAWNFLLTRPDPKIAATSVTADNLADNLWTEMAKWQNESPLLKETFEWQKTRIICRAHPETWWMSARSWPKSGTAEEQSNTLAGLHADYIMFILDESGSIPDAVMVSADAALSSCIEGHILQAGNPTHLTGPLYRATTSERKLWYVVEITGDPDDPKRSSRVKIPWAKEMIEKYGRSHPYVLVNVLGQFPPASLNVLIGPDEVAEAMRRSYRPEDISHAPRILGVDVARFGDDSSVVFPRQGLVSFIPLQYRNLRSSEGAGVVSRKWIDWDADAVFIDDTGGFGAGWIDALMQLGKAPIGVPFSGVANDPRYYNKRAEMYFDLVEWIQRGGQLPPRDAPGSNELMAALTTTTFTYRGDKFLLEPKELVKERLGYSPDFADALGLTFAQPVSPRHRADRRGRHQSEFDPFAGPAWQPPVAASRHLSSYDPFG
jgi:phage terminase large subunit